MTEPKKELLTLGPKGQVNLPEWVWKALLKESKVRSKKKRQQKKSVKKQLIKLINEAIDE